MDMLTVKINAVEEQILALGRKAVPDCRYPENIQKVIEALLRKDMQGNLKENIKINDELVSYDLL